MSEDVSPGLRVGGGLKRGRTPSSPRGLLVSPGLRVGGGLKRGRTPSSPRGRQVSPGLRVGGGLKPLIEVLFPDEEPMVSPGLRVGGGLKRFDAPWIEEVCLFPPACGSGAD